MAELSLKGILYEGTFIGAVQKVSDSRKAALGEVHNSIRKYNVRGRIVNLYTGEEENFGFVFGNFNGIDSKEEIFKLVQGQEFSEEGIPASPRQVDSFLKWFSNYHGKNLSK